MARWHGWFAQETLAGAARRRSRLLRLCLAGLLLASLSLTACGDDDPASTPGAAADATSTLAPSGPTLTATTAAEATPTDPPAATSTAAPPTPTTAPTATATRAATATATTAPEPLTLLIYFMRDEKIAATKREVPHTQQVAAAAVNALLEGPDEREEEIGMVSAIPEDTELNGITIVAGVATVDLSAEYESGGGSLSMAARLAQMVYTLTQFETVDSVVFELDGEPVEVFSGEGLIMDHPIGREDHEELTPAILVESPAPWEIVSSPLQITGTANTFEAVFQINIVDAAGLVVYDNFAMATSGSGTRGTFDETIEFTTTRPGIGALIVFEYSARDGSQINLVEIPLEFE
ncbi:MAG TPA: GerMN domain-containing protein [Thermomicrobiales bacterium]|nr:GerMN domain-containing protein [Thermomicrobiales bacterium]